MALDTIYRMERVVIRGNSTDPGSQSRPVPGAHHRLFMESHGNQLPYTYYHG